MAQAILKPTAFAGDENAEVLRAFFQSERQFDGDIRWAFGTSLKSAYVNSFEFLNHAPIVQLWKDAHGDVQAVSRISLGTGEWFQQIAPGFRDAATAGLMIEQADAALELLTDLERWRTVAYESDVVGIEQLVEHGYEPGEPDEVLLTMSLESGSLESGSLEPGTDQLDDHSETGVDDSLTVRLLNENDPIELRERALAQVDAFSHGKPSASELAWIHRTLPHQLAYAPAQSANIVAMDRHGTCHAFADVYFDHANRIGEFEPVGTRTASQRRGLAAAVMHRGLEAMRSADATTAVVRTGVDNQPAIAAYRSMGFEVVDQRISLIRRRQV